jgi:KUP system potassium uptake protein
MSLKEKNQEIGENLQNSNLVVLNSDFRVRNLHPKEVLTFSENDAVSVGKSYVKLSTNALLEGAAGLSPPSPTPSESDNAAPAHQNTSFLKTLNSNSLLAFQSVGIVYGDIGTSPLYTFSTVFTSDPTEDQVLGALSVMIWCLILIFGCKYLSLVLMVDHHGEGGTFALFARLREDLTVKPRVFGEKFTNFLLMVAPYVSAVAVGAILADGIITPAISVIGGVQGITIVSPSISQNVVVAVTCIILAIFYFVQHAGTGILSFIFSPIILLWFIIISIIGIYNISCYPYVLRAFGPDMAIRYFINYGSDAWVSLGGIFLCFTGTEALYADLGHFNRTALRMSSFVVVLPALLLCYCGQAAQLILNPSISSNVFYLSIPSAVWIPMIILATASAIIASQSILSASFSLTRQAMQLDFFPRLTIIHTSSLHIGRIYIPEANYLFMVLAIAIVSGFQNATALGYAYGLSVNLVFFITTLMYSVAIMVCLDQPWYYALPFLVFYSIIELVFLSSNLLKFVDGAWFTVVLASVFTLCMIVWRNCRLEMIAMHEEADIPLSSLNDANALIGPSCDTLLCFTKQFNHVPLPYMRLRNHLGVKPMHLILLRLKAVNAPSLRDNLTISQVNENVILALVEYGYCDAVPTYDSVVNTLAHAVLDGGKKLSTSNMGTLVFEEQVQVDKHHNILKRFYYGWFYYLYAMSTSIVPSLELPFESSIRITNPIVL